MQRKDEQHLLQLQEKGKQCLKTGPERTSEEVEIVKVKGKWVLVSLLTKSSFQLESKVFSDTIERRLNWMSRKKERSSSKESLQSLAFMQFTSLNLNWAWLFFNWMRSFRKVNSIGSWWLSPEDVSSHPGICGVTLLPYLHETWTHVMRGINTSYFHPHLLIRFFSCFRARLTIWLLRLNLPGTQSTSFDRNCQSCLVAFRSEGYSKTSHRKLAFPARQRCTWTKREAAITRLWLGYCWWVTSLSLTVTSSTCKYNAWGIVVQTRFSVYFFKFRIGHCFVAAVAWFSLVKRNTSTSLQDKKALHCSVPN